MLQAAQAHRSVAVLSVCPGGSQLLRKCVTPMVAYRVDLRASTKTKRIEPVVEAYVEPATPITIRKIGGGCGLLKSCGMEGFSKGAQLDHGFETRKNIKSSARIWSAIRRGERAGVSWREKMQSWKDRGTRSKQWE